MSTITSELGMRPGSAFGEALFAARAIFRRVVVGVDGSEPSLAACRQAARLAEPDAALVAVAIAHLGGAADAVVGDDELRRGALEALGRAAAILGDRATTRCVDGYVTEALLREVDRTDATLLALGSHGHRRAAEILFGGPAGELVHRAPCSVLVARQAPGVNGFPRAIVVGLDGSREGDLAHAAAVALAARFGSQLRTVAALQGKRVDLARVQLRAPLCEEWDAHPVDALVEASRKADLVVVGSRGLHGLRALGSVSERVAHQSACSVLVVRAARARP
jgi:nucleotide-binding universal stress UspA family protein